MDIIKELKKRYDEFGENEGYFIPILIGVICLIVLIIVKLG